MRKIALLGAVTALMIAGTAQAAGQMYNASRDQSSLIVTAGMIDNETFSDNVLLGARPGFDQKDINRQFTKISWESSLLGSGAVSYGTTRKLGKVVKSPEKGRLHEVSLSDLEPGAIYYYKIGLVDSGNGKRHLSRTFEFNTALNFSVPDPPRTSAPPSDQAMAFARTILAKSGVSKGYCIALAIGDAELLEF